LAFRLPIVASKSGFGASQYPSLPLTRPSPSPFSPRYASHTSRARSKPLACRSASYDEAAHDAFADMPPKMQAEAERKAAIARLLVSAGVALNWTQKVALARQRFGDDGTSEAPLVQIERAVEGVDAIDFAPAPVADYRLHGAPRAAVSGAAWSFFLTTIRDAGPQLPRKQAWRDVRDLKAVMGLGLAVMDHDLPTLGQPAGGAEGSCALWT